MTYWATPPFKCRFLCIRPETYSFYWQPDNLRFVAKMGNFKFVMKKRTLFSCLFFVAFAVSLVHNSIPHSHPETKASTVTKANSDNKAHGHNHGHEHTHDHPHPPREHNSSAHDQSSLPVFAHFSNVDFIRTSQYEFCGKERHLVVSLEPVRISVSVPESIEIRSFLPRPRQNRTSQVASVQSLRGPPSLS